MQDYHHNHQDRLNLVLHLFAVPLFILAHGLLIWGLLNLSWLLSATAAALIAASLRLQQWGHLREPNQPKPFLGAVDFGLRLYREQFYLYPHLVWFKLHQRFSSEDSSFLP